MAADTPLKPMSAALWRSSSEQPGAVPGFVPGNGICPNGKSPALLQGFSTFYLQ
jgi:hypothetical protein